MDWDKAIGMGDLERSIAIQIAREVADTLQCENVIDDVEYAEVRRLLSVKPKIWLEVNVKVDGDRVEVHADTRVDKQAGEGSIRYFELADPECFDKIKTFCRQYTTYKAPDGRVYDPVVRGGC